jgi:hypothetical protein
VPSTTRWSWASVDAGTVVHDDAGDLAAVGWRIPIVSRHVVVFGRRGELAGMIWYMWPV